jgi:hypothetical protein
MSQAKLQHDVPPAIEQKLAQVRRGIRTYVWLEGLAAIVVTIAAAFWVGMLLDWMFEPSPQVRIATMIGVGIVGLWVAYRQLLRRAFVSLPDASLAVLLERRFPQLKDQLLTSVDLATGDDHSAVYHPEMVTRTRSAAAAAVAQVNSSDVFRRGPLAKWILAAVVLAVSIPIFAFAARDAFGFWLDRIALSTEQWPRRVHLEVVGFPPDANGRRTQKVAHDDAFELVVQADTKNFNSPDEVEFRFESVDGGRGRDSMIRVGDAVKGRDDFQAFRYEFEDVTTSMKLDVIGGDDRVEGLYLQIVDRPELVGMEVECEYPAYLNRPPRRLPITGGMRIPEGTKLTLHAGSTKPLTKIEVQRSQDAAATPLAESATPTKELRWDYGPLTADDVVTIRVTDTDGVACREPYRVSLSVVPDELPQVSVRLTGIGSAITPDAIVPMVGRVVDDYGLGRVWYAYQINDGEVREREMFHQPEGAQDTNDLDAFDARGPNGAGGERAMELQPGETLFLSVRASDEYDLSDSPRVGSSQQFALDIVTAPQLLAMLEKRELELRQRFEAVHAKMTDTRNLLGRVDFKNDSEPAVNEAEAVEAEAAEAEATANDKNAATATPAATADRALARRRLRVAGALQNVTQSAHEVLGLSVAFEDIYGQIENNRIDNVDLKNRLREQIALPLRHLAEDSMSQLESQLELVSDRVANPATGATALADATQQADVVLVEMQQILDRMLELESYNEVVGLLRGIIDDQKQLNDRTKKQQTDKLRDLFDE